MRVEELTEREVALLMERFHQKTKHVGVMPQYAAASDLPIKRGPLSYSALLLIRRAPSPEPRGRLV